MYATQELGERLVNLCPHDVCIIKPDGTELILPRPAKPARISVVSGEPTGTVSGVTVLGPARYSHISDLPDPEPGVMFIVSQITALAASALLSRCDIVYPGTAADDKPKRSPEGKLQAVRCLVKVK